MGNRAVTFTDLIISLRDEADVGVGPEVGGQRADWGNAREGPAVGSSYTDDSRCEMTLKELGRQKGRPQRGAHTGAG